MRNFMHIVISKDLKARLEDPRNFKSFKVVVEPDAISEAQLATALGPIGTVADSKTVWISEQWLRGQPEFVDDKAWQDSLSGMIQFAKKHGWVDEAKGTIRAHVEQSGT